MYRVKGNGLSYPITLYTKINDPVKVKNQRVYFKIQKKSVQAFVNDQIIGEVMTRQEMNIVRHILQLSTDYYAWVEDVQEQNIAVTIARPTEIIIERQSIAINLSKLDKPIDISKYMFNDLPLQFNKEVAYIAQHKKTKQFYLFSKEVKGRKFALVLNWEMDQLFAIKEDSMSYRADEKTELLQMAKVFVTDLLFYDSTAELQDLSTTVEKAFPLHFGEEKGYLAAWDEYMQYEKKKLDEISKQCKKLSYSSYKVSYGKVTFFLEGMPNVEAWKDKADEITVETTVRNKTVRVGTLRFVSQKKVEVDYSFEDILDGVPFEQKGFLSVSRELEEVAQRRRSTALRKTIGKTTVIPDLGKFLSDPSTVQDIRLMNYHFPLHNVSTLVNGKLPDIPQEDAIKAALNTEDIVLIQGPPGTGKTSVIQTIMKCLIELGQKDILLTSYQHLAVDNAMQGLTEHGVLSHRFGGETYQQQLMASYQEIVEKMVKPILDITSFEDTENQFIEQLLLDLEHYAAQELNSASIKNLGDYVDRLKNTDDVPTDVFIALLGLSDALPLNLEIEKQVPTQLVKLYNQLPKEVAEIKTTAHVEQWTSFYECAKSYFKVQQNEEILTLIDTMKQLRRKLVLLRNNEPLLLEMAEVLKQLRAICEPTLKSANASADYIGVKEAIQRVIIELNEEKLNSKTAIVSEEQQVLQEYAMQLQSNPLDLAKIIGRYAQVKGATCQQTVAQRHGMYDLIFDAVIIDEAARANPLDLLIPMTLGKKIILVGDHKQLPHILEPDFEKETDLSSADFQNIYSKSLFERLFKELPSSKRVMLKKQFRMHPHIGRLVSKLFYPEGLLHGLDESALSNDSGVYNGHHLAWLDVPYTQGGEAGRYYNIAEADVVVYLVKELLKDAKNIGKISVITFYSEQLAQLKQHFQNHGLEEQVAVGTVDAFQGKESEIVILSTVRSNRFNSPGRALGFLRSPNRFNVALSRARSLLIVVGDSKTLRKSEMFEHAYRYIEECGVIDEYRRT